MGTLEHGTEAPRHSTAHQFAGAGPQAVDVIDLNATPFTGPLPSIDAPGVSPQAARVVKDVLDRVCAGLLILVLMPLFAVIALSVRLSSPGPVLYRQTRVGLHNEPFQFYKFRTMVDGAEQLIDLLSDRNECDGVLFKMRDDPRMTAVGRWLRRFSLDELPQLWHVLTGKMSLVGPRPALPEEVAGYDPHVNRRHAVKPGVTGLWQVSGRSDLPWQDAVALDLQYVENWSLALDTRIFLRTLPAVVTGRGAY